MVFAFVVAVYASTIYSGIKVESDNKWLTLNQNASKFKEGKFHV